MKASKCDFKDILWKESFVAFLAQFTDQRQKAIDEIESKHGTIKPPKTEAPENDVVDELTQGIRNLSAVGGTL